MTRKQMEPGAFSSDSTPSSARFRPLTQPPPAARRKPQPRALEDSGPSIEELAGRTIGNRYRIGEPLGAGGMGLVYAAVDAVSGEPVAIKVLRARAMSKENLRRFRREIQAASAVRHEALCQVRELGVENGIPFLVMERVEGEPLRRRLQREGPLPVADAISVTLQLLQALEAVHSAKVLHRDVKPANVMLVSRGGGGPRVKLIDFGLARPLFESSDATSITTTGVIPGTPAYLSPEQIVGTKKLDARVDVWGAGMTFYEALAAHHPFVGDSFDSLAYQLTVAPLPDLKAFRQDVPGEVELVLRYALAKRREERYPSARAFHDALAEAWALNRVRGLRRGKMLVEKAIPLSIDEDDTQVIPTPPRRPV